jgi:uncharacterized phosphatase
MKLILVRHGQTDLNTKRVYQGKRTDKELNEVGIGQVKKTAEFLKDFDFDLIISSPLKRAMKTAQIINEFHNKEIKTLDEITERDFGDFEGESYDNVDYPKVKKDDTYEKFSVERPTIFRERVEKFLDEIHKEHFGKTILVVSHGGTLKMLLSILKKIPWEVGVYEIKKPNASISIIDIDEKRELKNHDIGNVEHLN